MQGVIYLDILVAVNALLGWFLLRATQMLSHQTGVPWRMACGAFLAGASALLICLPSWHILLLLCIKFVALCLIVWVAFSFRDVRTYCKTLLWYVCCNMLLSGVAILGASSGLQPILYRNFSIYLAVQPLYLLGCALVVYLIVSVVQYCFAVPSAQPTATITLMVQGARVVCTALRDTGFLLNDPFTGDRVVLFSFPQIEQQLPSTLRCAIDHYYTLGDIEPQSGLRLLSVQTATGATLMPGVTAQKEHSKKTICAVFTAQPLQGGFDAVQGA